MMPGRTDATTPQCEACGEPATRQDCEGVWLCEGDFQHMIDHWLIEEAASSDSVR